MLAITIVVGLLLCMVAGSSAAQWPAVTRRFVRHVPTGTIVIAAAIAGPALFLLPPTGATTAVQVVVGIALVGALGLGAFLFGVNLAGFDPDAGTIASRLAVDEASQRLLSRWTHRVRWRRWIGGTSGVVLAVFSSNPTWLIFAGLTGAALGSISAEFHLCRPSPTARRVVSLERRQMRDYLTRWSVAELAFVLMLAVAASIIVSIDQQRLATPGWLVGAIGVVALALAMIGLVVHRRRPALSQELRAADDLLRRLAISNGIAAPMASVGLMAIATGLHQHGFEGAAIVVGFLAIIGWWRNRRGGLDYVLKHPVRAAHLLTASNPA